MADKGYPAGMRKHRVTIVNRKQAKAGPCGIDTNGIEWENGPTVSCAVGWAKGVRALNAGSIDAYGVINIRMNWNKVVNIRSRVFWNGQTYQILPETFHADSQANTIEFTAQMIVNDK